MHIRICCHPTPSSFIIFSPHSILFHHLLPLHPLSSPSPHSILIHHLLFLSLANSRCSPHQCAIIILYSACCNSQSISPGCQIAQFDLLPVFNEEVLDSLTTFNTLKQHFTADAWMAVVQRCTVAWLCSNLRS